MRPAAASPSVLGRREAIGEIWSPLGHNGIVSIDIRDFPLSPGDTILVSIHTAPTDELLRKFTLYVDYDDGLGVAAIEYSPIHKLTDALKDL